MTRTHLLRDQSGFTLVELVVSLGILALMTAFMVEGISLLRRGSTVLERVEGEDADRTVEAHLRRALERAVPVFVENADTTRTLIFDGEADRLSLVSRADGRLEPGGLVRIDFRIDEAGDARRFITERRPFRVDAKSGEPVHLLVDDVAGVGFRYYGRATPEAPLGWSPRWINAQALPQLVELTVVRAEGKPGWPPLVFALPASGVTN